jgi:hypothetical protein
MSRTVQRVLVAALAWATLGSVAFAGETKAADAAEAAGNKIGEAADKTADEAKKVGRAVKSKTKKALKATGAAVEQAGNKIDGPAR